MVLRSLHATRRLANEAPPKPASDRTARPRVRIEYEVEVSGALKKVELPFVIGVLADLSGKPAEPGPEIVDRKFVELDPHNLDDALKAFRPRVAFAVPNTLTGDGALNVEMTFEKMEDFSPGAVAHKVPALETLLTARNQLTKFLNLDKSGTEQIIAKLLEAVSLPPKQEESSSPKKDGLDA
ncbi:MAG: type VI secretion system contractile sheath small subunit [Verrucomicrobiia bacterium]